MTRSLFLAWVLLLAAAAGVAGQEPAYRAPAARDGTVSIHAGGGRVRVVGWSRDEVAATWRGRRDAHGEEERKKGPLRVASGRREVRFRVVGDGEVEVRVPAGSRVSVVTRSGDVEVQGVTGAVDLESATGDFRVDGTPRRVSAEGLSGDFEMRGSTPTLRVKTMSGDVRVPRAEGFVELTTVTGNILVGSRGVRRGTLRSTAGLTRFSGSVPRDGSLRFENSKGEIELRLPRGLAADFELTSLGGGEIHADVGDDARRTRSASGVEVLRFSSGSGGAEITARTVDGVIRLRRQ